MDKDHTKKRQAMNQTTFLQRTSLRCSVFFKGVALGPEIGPRTDAQRGLLIDNGF